MSSIPSPRAAAYLAWCVIALASVGAPGIAPTRDAAQVSVHTGCAGHAGLFVSEAGEEVEVGGHSADDLDDESASQDNALGTSPASLRLPATSAPRVRVSHGHEQDVAGAACDLGVNGARAPPRV